MNKKGSFTDWFYIIAIVFMTAIVVVISTLIVSTARTAGSDIWDDSPTAEGALETAENTLLNFDNMMLFVIVGLSIFVLVSSAMVYQHPAFFVVGFILLCIAVIVAAMISNSYWTFADSSAISATASQFTKITFLMNNLPLYIAFMGMAAAIAAYISYSRG